MVVYIMSTIIYDSSRIGAEYPPSISNQEGLMGEAGRGEAMRAALERQRRFGPKNVYIIDASGSRRALPPYPEKFEIYELDLILELAQERARRALSRNAPNRRRLLPGFLRFPLTIS